MVVISRSEYERLSHPQPSFIDLVWHSPLVGEDISLEREQILTRNVRDFAYPGFEVIDPFFAFSATTP